MNPRTVARLEELNIQLMTEARNYCMFVRENLVAIAHRAEDGRFASLGSTGIMTENGLAYLVWREGKPMVAAHGGVKAAVTQEEADAILRFSLDLKDALELDA